MTQSRYKMPVAIVGMACQLPGADDLESYRKLILSGGCAIREVPENRLDMSLYYDGQTGVPGKTSSRLGAFISQKPLGAIAAALPSGLRERLDPTHLRFCEVTGEALTHAGYDPFALPCRETSVYVGHDTPSTLTGDLALASYVEEAVQKLHQIAEYNRLTSVDQLGLADELVAALRKRLPSRTVLFPDVVTSMVAGVVTHAFQLTGPFQAVDSACASSLQAIHLAVRSLQSGECNISIAGGVADWKIDTAAEFSKSGAISRTGSRPFDDGADGVICGEGYVALILKRLPDAVRDQDRIYGVVTGVGASTDGRGKGIWAPNAEGQMKAIRRAYHSTEELARLQYIEAHATSTQLGDATELQAWGGVLQDVLTTGKKLPITSVKANIGHTLEAAGIAGVIKALLCMQETAIPGQIQFNTPNSNVDWETLPLYVPTERTPWPSPGNGIPRKAGVDAFGLGGFNVHVALEEYVASRSTVAVTGELPSEGLGQPEPIAVIGRGCLLESARNLEQFPKKIFESTEERTTQREIFSLNDFQYDWRRHKIAPRQIMQSNPLQFYLLEAVDQAMIESGYSDKQFPGARTATLVGAEYCGDFTDHLQIGLRVPEILQELRLSLQSCQIAEGMIDLICERYTELCLEQWPEVTDESGSFHFSSLASRISRTWDVNGPACVLDRGASSGVAALQTAWEMLQAGDCDLAICASGHRRLGLPRLEMEQLKEPRATQETTPLAEGAGAVVLKRLTDANRDGDTVHFVMPHKPTELSLEDDVLKNQIGDLSAANGMFAFLKQCVTTTTSPQ